MNAQERYPLEWIDEYAARIRDYVFVREEDSILIKVPNEAHRLNASGVRILQRLFSGESIVDLWKFHGAGDEVRRDLYQFFCALKQMLQGCVDEARPPEAVEVKPFALGFNRLPVLSEIALTYRCNLRCRFCYAGCACTSKPTAQEMTTAEACEVLRIIREDAQVPSVSFTGGEPLLREDLCELIAAARALGLRVNLITNGTRVTPEAARALAEAGLHSAQVSIEAPSAELHDALVGVSGAFEAACAGVGFLRATGIRVHTNTTLNRLNLDTAGEMPMFVRGLGLERFSMNLIIPMGSGQNDPELALRYEKVAAHIPRIHSAAKRAGVEFMWYSPTPLCMFNPIPQRLGNKGCAACDGLLSVAPDGGVLPCSSWPEPVGNVFSTPFRTIWDSARAQGLREKRFAAARCRECEDFALCQGACPLYWRHFGDDELNRYGEAYVASSARSR